MAIITRGAGTTHSERYLARLADRAFLRLWSYPNLFIDKKQHEKGVGKEFCDLLVVFDNDVIIFSDKEVTWPDTNDISTAWARWFRKAIGKSADQINGAERWLRQFPDRLYLDPLCTEQIPLDLPPLDKLRVHGVAIASGAMHACKNFFSGGSGTFTIMPSIKGCEHFKLDHSNFSPFAIGDINPERSFIHVFDEQALDFVMNELNTVSDFIRYLNRREWFIRSGHLAAAPGEEDLLGYYLQTEDDNGEHDFIAPDGRPISGDTHVIIEQGQYERLITRPEYLRKSYADKISFSWDALIEKFIHHILDGTSVSVFGETPDAKIAERALRIMASETRFKRRVLSQSFLDALEEADRRKADRFARVMLSGDEADEVAYILLILAYPTQFELKGGYDQYRKVRANFLHAYCLGVLEENRHIKRAVGIGIDASPEITGRKGGSEDLIAVEVNVWTDDLIAQTTELKSKFQILDPKRQKVGGLSATEYPSETPDSVEPLTRQQRRAFERQKRKRNRNKKS